MQKTNKKEQKLIFPIDKLLYKMKLMANTVFKCLYNLCFISRLQKNSAITVYFHTSADLPVTSPNLPVTSPDLPVTSPHLPVTKEKLTTKRISTPITITYKCYRLLLIQSCSSNCSLGQNIPNNVHSSVG